MPSGWLLYQLVPSKAEPLILVKDSGIVIEVRLEQPLKVSYPILVTELGIAIEVRVEQS